MYRMYLYNLYIITHINIYKVTNLYFIFSVKAKHNYIDYVPGPIITLMPLED